MIIAAQGPESEKIVDGKRIKTIPFVGTDREGEFSSMGVGLVYPDEKNGTIWGLAMPHMLIKSWRAMKILEHVETIDRGTLCSCWYAGGHEIHDSDKHRLDELAEKVGGMEKLQAIRDAVLASAPTADELNSMIAILREKDVDFEYFELEMEADAGRIERLPIIETLKQEEQAKRDQYAREEEEVNRPLPTEGSLGVFFGELGIDNFIDGPAIGGYGWDWGHMERDKLDAATKRASFSKYSDCFKLEHTTQGPYTKRAPVAPGVTAYSTTFGELEQPYLVAMDGTKYTFLSARFEGELMHVKTKIEKKEGDPTEGDYTLAQLREMIGPVPPPAHEVPAKGLLATMAGWFR